MARKPGPQVVVYELRERSDKKKQYVVAWRVGKSQPRRAFSTKKEADTFRSQLIAARADGQRFNPTTNLPEKWNDKSNVSLADAVHKWFRQNYTSWAPKTRKSAAEPLRDLLIAMVKDPNRALPASTFSSLTPQASMHRQIMEWLSTSPQNAKTPLWLAKNTLLMSDITKQKCADVDTRLRLRLDGTSKMITTQRRFRSNINAFFNWACDTQEFLELNPWPQSNRAPRRSDRKKSVITNSGTPVNQQSLLSPSVAIATIDRPIGKTERKGLRARRLLLAIVWLAGLRPGEAVALQIEDCKLPKTGWGELKIVRAKTDAGRRWTGAGEHVGGPKTVDRIVPIPPELVLRIVAHVGDRTSGLVAPNERGEMVAVENLSKTWRSLRPDKSRPYDLRAARASLHVNIGRPLATVALEMGHSKETLLKHYLRPFEGDEEVGLKEVERLLDGTVKRHKR
jgi:integrase